MKLDRHRADRLRVGRDVLARDAIAARGGNRQLSALIPQIQRQPIDLRLRSDGEIRRKLRLHRAVPGLQILQREDVLQGEEALEMSDWSKASCRRIGANILRRRILGGQFGMGRLDITQLVDETIIVIVRDLRSRPRMVGHLRAGQQRSDFLPAGLGLRQSV